MPTDPGQKFNWYHRYWHDWPEVADTVYEVAKAHARYLGYEVYGPNPPPSGPVALYLYGCHPPPGDLGKVGPVARITLRVFRRSGRHKEPVYENLYVDVERRAGKFHPKKVAATPTRGRR
jgi:hypothetical protein